MIGMILVAEGKISVRVVDADLRGATTTEYPQVTVEDLADAARVLGKWMNVKSEDCDRHRAEPIMSDKKTAWVRVRLADRDRMIVWREVEAETLDQAIKIVEQQADIEVVLEASWTPGGAVT